MLGSLGTLILLWSTRLLSVALLVVAAYVAAGFGDPAEDPFQLTVGYHGFGRLPFAAMVALMAIAIWLLGSLCAELITRERNKWGNGEDASP